MDPGTSDAGRLLIDTHCHLYWPGLAERADEIVKRALEAGIGIIVVPGINEETSLAAQALAQRFQGVYYAAGVHPSEAGSSDGFQPAEFFAPFVGDPKLVAVGEIGLDAHYDPSAVEQQRLILRAQLEYAADCGLPGSFTNGMQGGFCWPSLSASPSFAACFTALTGARGCLTMRGTTTSISRWPGM